MGKLKIVFNYIRSFFPQPLPRSTKDFDQFVDSIFTIYNIPKLPSYVNAVATMILHMGPLEHRKSKRHFVASIRKAMANQIAYGKIQEIKEAEKAEEAKLEAEKVSEQVV